MAEFIQCDTANEAWIKITNKLLNKNETVSSRNGDTYEEIHALLSIKDPRQKWIYDRVPPISIGYALAELVWILSGDDKVDTINFFNPRLQDYAGNSHRYHGAYGKRIRSHFGFDQLEKAFYVLQSVSDSRQVVIQVHDIKEDTPLYIGEPSNKDIPCSICSMLKIRNNKLEWSHIMRSNDIFLGLPYDIVQFTSLQEVIAGWLGIEVGGYCHYADSIHLYNSDKDKIGIANNNNIISTDNLSISKKEFDNIIKEIYSRMVHMTSKRLKEPHLVNMSKLDSSYDAYNNIVYILSAYTARRNKMPELANYLIDKCTNNMYKTIWNMWITSKANSIKN